MLKEFRFCSQRIIFYGKSFEILQLKIFQCNIWFPFIINNAKVC